MGRSIFITFVAVLFAFEPLVAQSPVEQHLFSPAILDCRSALIHGGWIWNEAQQNPYLMFPEPSAEVRSVFWKAGFRPIWKETPWGRIPFLERTTFPQISGAVLMDIIEFPEKVATKYIRTSFTGHNGKTIILFIKRATNRVLWVAFPEGSEEQDDAREAHEYGLQLIGEQAPPMPSGY